VQQPTQLQLRRTKSSQKKMMLSALHVLTAQGLLQAGWKVAVPWPVHSRLRSSSSTSAAVDGALRAGIARSRISVFSRKFIGNGENRNDKLRARAAASV
jgi:hypothetical protein